MFWSLSGSIQISDVALNKYHIFAFFKMAAMKSRFTISCNWMYGNNLKCLAPHMFSWSRNLLIQYFGAFWIIFCAYMARIIEGNQETNKIHTFYGIHVTFLF